MLNPINVKDPEAFMSHLSKGEQSCLSENGDSQQLLMLMNSPDITPQEREVLAGCYERVTL